MAMLGAQTTRSPSVSKYVVLFSLVTFVTYQRCRLFVYSSSALLVRHNDMPVSIAPPANMTPVKAVLEVRVSDMETSLIHGPEGKTTNSSIATVSNTAEPRHARPQSSELVENNAIAPATTVEQMYPHMHNRSIVLVHVGKAGGTSIRHNLMMGCFDKDFNKSENDDKKKWHKSRCQKYIKAGQVLSVRTQDIFHVFGKNTTALEEATTYVVTLRDPVSRVLSAYRYSHPANCVKPKDPKKRMPGGTRGCNTLKSGKLDDPKSTGYKLWTRCFPSAGIEDFAQSLLPPWKPNPAFQNLTIGVKSKCRSMARELVMGDKILGSLVPHLRYNYRYYAEESIWKYRDKEVLGVRTEHEWDDMVAVDQWMGGSGNFQNHGKHFSHGSEYYHPSPVSKEAYEKLCCVLEDEIDVYLDLLGRAENLDATAKQEAEDRIRQKCGINATMPWTEWRSLCQNRIQESKLASSRKQ